MSSSMINYVSHHNFLQTISTGVWRKSPHNTKRKEKVPAYPLVSSLSSWSWRCARSSISQVLQILHHFFWQSLKVTDCSKHPLLNVINSSKLHHTWRNAAKSRATLYHMILQLHKFYQIVRATPSVIWNCSCFLFDDSKWSTLAMAIYGHTLIITSTNKDRVLMA